MAEEIQEDKLVPTYCQQCNAGCPDLLKVHVVNGIAVGIEPNNELAHIHPADAKVCVKAYGLIQKNYNPNRIKSPMKRTNPKKGKDEDPGWVEISWDEALNLLAGKLLKVRGKGLLDENGYPRVAFHEGGAGTSASILGTFFVLFCANGHPSGSPQGVFGPIDMTLGSGKGVKCNHTEHLLGELWHKSFISMSDTPYTRYLISFGRNDNATNGVVGVRRHSEARARGLKRIQIEPHLSVTGATADEWIPIKPGTDHSFLYAMIYTVLHELDWRKVSDIQSLKKMTNSPYLVAPDGYFLRDKATRKPLIWDNGDNKAKVFDALDIKDPALEGEYTVTGITIGPDDRIEEFTAVKVKPSFVLLIEHVKNFTPEWAAKECDIPASAIRRVTKEFFENAMVGATVKIEGEEIPLRPVAITQGIGVNCGRGAIQALWTKHVLEMLAGSIEVAGGDLGVVVLISGPPERSEDGFLTYPFHPTNKEQWKFPPGKRDGVPSLIPLAGGFDGPYHLVWRWLLETPENWPKPSIPEVYISFKSNPMVSQFDPPIIMEVLKKIPFFAAIAYTIDETAWFADLLLPEDSDLENLQIYPCGATNERENFWEHSGIIVKQPAVKRSYNTMNISDIATELAARLGLLGEYNEALNQGAYLGIKLKNTPYELKPDVKYTAEKQLDSLCKVLTKGEHGLEWFKQTGGMFHPFLKTGDGELHGNFYMRPWYLLPVMKRKGIRFELPYQERLKRIGEELGARLHEKGIHWWDSQVEEHQALIEWEDTNKFLDSVATKLNKNPEDYPFWLLTTHSMQYAWSSNVAIPLMMEVSNRSVGGNWAQMNRKTAEKLGIKGGDEIWIESAYAKTKGKVALREGIRPDCILTVGTFGQWITPYAKDFVIPNLNDVAPALVELTDEGGASKNHAKVKVYKA